MNALSEISESSQKQLKSEIQFVSITKNVNLLNEELFEKFRILGGVEFN